MADRWAKKKEAIILAIDIGKNSRQRDSDGKTYFEKSIYCASTVLKKKILTESEDHLALILFGSSHTINHLSTTQGGCYGSIETVAGLGIPTWDLFNRVNSLSPTNITPSDWISTFVLAADLLKNETENKVYTGLQIIMFSNLATDISFDNIDIIATCLKMEHIRLSILGKDCGDISLNPASGLFVRTTEATAVNFDLVLPKISYYKQKEVIAKSWNAPLSFGEVFGIKVCGYEKIDITTKSSNWLFSKNYDTQDLATAKKKHSDDNGEQMEVDNALPMGDFYSGDEIIPVIDLDTEECTYIVSGRRCLQVLGFVKTTNTQSSFLMDGGSYIFKPYKTDIIAFNAVFDSMVERKEVMLVRKVDLYINLLNIGALIPQKVESEKFFVYVSLPYENEQNYKYRLPSLDSIASHLKGKINPKHTDAMDIDIDDGNKFVMPEIKYNFELQYLYDCIVKQILKKTISKKIQCSKKTIKPCKSMMENGGPRLKDFLKRISFKREFFENFPSIHNTIQLRYDEEFDVSNEFINTPKSFIKNAKPRSNKLKKKCSLKQEVFENCSTKDENTIHSGNDEELDGSNKLINPPKSFIKNAKPRSNKLKKKCSLKQEVFENCSTKDDNTIHFGNDEELDGSNKLINPPKSFIKNAKPRSNKLKKKCSLKQEVFENCSTKDENTIHSGNDEELDGSNKLINPPKSFIKNAKPRSNKLKKKCSLKQEVFDNCSTKDDNTIHFRNDEELDGSNKLINPSKTSIKNAKPRSNKFKKKYSLKQEVFENCSTEDNNTIHFGYDEELDGSNKLINPPTPIENADPLISEFKKTFSIKQEVFENCQAEDNNPIHFGNDEELDGSNEFKNLPKTPIKNAEPLLSELQKTFSIKQEVFENCQAEDYNTLHFGYDEELDGSNKLINRPKTPIENDEPLLSELQKTFSIKQEVFENCQAEDYNTLHFGYDEELDGSNKLINRAKTPIENDEPLLSELQKTFSIKQEVFENCQAEDYNTLHFGYDEELDVSNELINPPKSFIKNAEPLLNEFKKTFSLKQEVLENCPAEDNNTTQFGHDEELDVSNELINPPKSFIENAEPPLNEFVKTFSLKQEVFENSSVEDNNATNVDREEELDLSKQCVITPLNPIEDFNKLLKNGFDSAIVCKKMQYVTLNLIKFSTNLEDLMKPVATLKALREYYIINNDEKSYNNFMHLAKDAVLISGKEDMWSKFINSGIGLITNAEIEASDISQESSEEFKKLSEDFDINFIIDDDSQLK
ncbi:uncharacterized protein LOC132937144 isoform X1 [Metopolophium dirhodum]|uniref:uncharacterized protein LOC132937144 isoform X1 n=1 Tax=Metopolophium dirhodum TaxID=44670 RepID=UPI00298F5393|nr:uncharacterized protein LOC132937144 isoform X1 [Metopolophium dirhodum]